MRGKAVLGVASMGGMHAEWIWKGGGVEVEWVWKGGGCGVEVE